MTEYRDHYFPNTETLGEHEMRIIALGTGRPFLRRSQVNAGWLIELGNGDKFMFDFGFGTQVNFSALEIPYNALTAIFATHLHTDHVGDFMQIRQGGWSGGRMHPLQVYGPSGPIPEYGTKWFVDHQRLSYRWDEDTRHGLLPAIGAEIDVHEFDYARTHVVYEHNCVTITSFPAVHIYDGPVSLRLDWSGLSFVYSGDTTPSYFFVENAKNADLVVHETFDRVQTMMEKAGYDERAAIGICTMAHSDPQEAGRVFELIAPRLAVGYHFYNDLDTQPAHHAAVRKHYKGPLVFAKDFMTFNVTKERIVTRMAVTSPDTWPNKRDHDEGLRKAARKERMQMSPWLSAQQIFPKKF